MEFQDKVIACIECGVEFVFTAGEQSFFYDKKFTSPPKRCKSCKSKRTLAFGDPPAAFTSLPRLETPAVCSQCGKQTTVPFKPTQGRPVYCRECYQDRRGSAVSA